VNSTISVGSVPVHPRTCGEQILQAAQKFRAAGSSPHVRGTVQRIGTGANQLRFIPARAGNSRSRQSVCRASSVHPRTCGEQIVDETLYSNVAGSSPHVRGTALKVDGELGYQRFIPARAGNRGNSAGRSWPVPVHPRTCGEQIRRPVGRYGQGGSSPHVRGTGLHVQGGGVPVRFIPARAGNRDLASAIPTPYPVHPRTCGEQKERPLLFHTRGGSSPHVRGTDRWGMTCAHRTRFIPARAGNSGARYADLGFLAVHPRTCGEQSRSLSKAPSANGSSPHVRGTGDGITIYHGDCRFIPARAGNRHFGLDQLFRIAVHPRTCGEQVVFWYCAAGSYGSSPHVRGTALITSRASPQRRFIPARAGNRLHPYLSSGGSTVHPRTCGEQ